MEYFPKIPVPIQLAHPHDLLTRFFLFDAELFAGLLENYGNTGVIRQIDRDSLRNETPTTVNYHLQEVIGDLRYSAKFNTGGLSKVFLFFEHQSTKVKRFCLRCLRKLLEFYESCEGSSELLCDDGKFPYAVVVLLYHGETLWDVLQQMSDLVLLPAGAERQFLSFPVVVIDLSKIPKEELKGHPALMALLDALQSASEGKLAENFSRIVGYFETINDDPRTYGWLNAITHYFFAVTKADEEIVTATVSKILDKQETEKMVMSTMEELFTKGKLEGKLESEIKSVLTTLKKRFKIVPKSISQSVNSYKDPMALESLFELAMDCETLEEFEQGLAH
jgi:predicted transposase/invertase (TIGR01784 family)